MSGMSQTTGTHLSVSQILALFSANEVIVLVVGAGVVGLTLGMMFASNGYILHRLSLFLRQLTWGEGLKSQYAMFGKRRRRRN
jgi:hypothetical protein